MNENVTETTDGDKPRASLHRGLIASRLLAQVLEAAAVEDGADLALLQVPGVPKLIKLFIRASVLALGWQNEDWAWATCQLMGLSDSELEDVFRAFPHGVIEDDMIEESSDE